MANHITVAGLAKSTAHNYVRALRDLQERTGKPADKLTRDELLAYLAARRKHLSPSTLNTVICALKYYYREVAQRLDLVVDIPNPRRAKQLGELLNADELRTLLSAARSMRHRLVLELLFGLGLRAAEVGRLRLEHVWRPPFGLEKATFPVTPVRSAGQASLLPLVVPPGTPFGKRLVSPKN